MFWRLCSLRCESFHSFGALRGEGEESRIRLHCWPHLLLPATTQTWFRRAWRCSLRGCELARSPVTCVDSTSGHLYLSHEDSACSSHMSKQAPLSFRDVSLESEAADIRVYVFLYLSLHQSNLVTRKSPPHSSRWGSGEKWGTAS